MRGEADLPPAAARVQAALHEAGLAARVRVLPDSTRSAEEAARAIGTTVAQIAKSLVFRGHESGDPVLVVASGANRVDELRVAALFGEPVSLASPDYVRERTGYAVGGVPPVGLRERPATLLDEDLFEHGEIWAAAGTPRAVFPTSPTALREATGGTVAAVRVEPSGGPHGPDSPPTGTP